MSQEPTTQSERPADAGAQQPSTARLEALLGQILLELKRRPDDAHGDFSVSKLLAGIVQIVALAVLFIAYLNRDAANLQPILLFAIALQTLTIALLIMGRQR
jgi:hypothetical protein